MVSSLIHALDSYYLTAPTVSKTEAIRSLVERLNLIKAGRSVYMNQHPQFALRFCYASGPGFSNTVLSLKALIQFDHVPFIVCLIRENTYELMLANSTFLHKISHSSHTLRPDNIVGSFLGQDIIKEYAELANTPANFTTLYTIHSAIDLEENIKRLVDTTSNIVATKQKSFIDASLRDGIYRSVSLFCSQSYTKYYETIKLALDSIIAQNAKAILEFAVKEPSNVNIRGNKIEQIITGLTNEHKFEDFSWQFDDGVTALIDIKTHIAGLSSSPKHQNIDKFLTLLSAGNVLSFIYYVHVDSSAASVTTKLIGNLEKKLIQGLRIQHHWAGRNRRGVTQIDTAVHAQIHQNWQHSIDEGVARDFIDRLIGL